MRTRRAYWPVFDMKYALSGHAVYVMNEVIGEFYFMCATLAAQRLPPGAESEAVYLYGGGPLKLVVAYAYGFGEGAAQWINVETCGELAYTEEEYRREVDGYILHAARHLWGDWYFAEAVFLPGELVHGLVLATPSPNCRCLYRAALLPYSPKSRLLVDLDVAELRAILERALDKLEEGGYDASRDRAVLKELEDPSWEQWAEERCKKLAAETAIYSLEPAMVGNRLVFVRTRVPDDYVERRARAHFKLCPKWLEAALEGIRRRPA